MSKELTEVVSVENAFSTILCRADEEDVDYTKDDITCNEH